MRLRECLEGLAPKSWIFGEQGGHKLLKSDAIAAGLSERILPEGTPGPLISVEDWSSKTVENGGPIAFMLARDLQVDGVIVAPIASKRGPNVNPAA